MGLSWRIWTWRRKREDGLDAPLGEPDPNAVQILTVHGSKGLEWDGVVVFGLADGSFPLHKSKSPAVDG